ncbi:hypothetical protein H0Z60_16595 [Ectothiorhodospiraceae bacterium WFHF3C12]|nr:hypothetical protein [Ectothiorhodospiraceae bacterium WFHF3C12]
MNVNRKTGAAIALAAAGLFASGVPAVASAESGTNAGKCFGVNACKGRSSCKTANSSCKGHNACKGKGFVTVSEETCEQLGGDFRT